MVLNVGHFSPNKHKEKFWETKKEGLESLNVTSEKEAAIDELFWCYNVQQQRFVFIRYRQKYSKVYHEVCSSVLRDALVFPPESRQLFYEIIQTLVLSHGGFNFTVDVSWFNTHYEDVNVIASYLASTTEGELIIGHMNFELSTTALSDISLAEAIDKWLAFQQVSIWYYDVLTQEWGSVASKGNTHGRTRATNSLDWLKDIPEYRHEYLRRSLFDAAQEQQVRIETVEVSGEHGQGYTEKISFIPVVAETVASVVFVLRCTVNQMGNKHQLTFFDKRWLEILHQGVWCLNAAGKTIFMNKKMRKTLGYSKSDVFEKPAVTFVEDEYVPYLKNVLNESYDKHVKKFELPLVKADGGICNTSCTLLPLFSSEKQLAGTFISVGDVSAEEKQTDISKLHQQTFDCAMHSMAILDYTGRIQSSNKAFDKLMFESFGVMVKPNVLFSQMVEQGSLFNAIERVKEEGHWRGDCCFDNNHHLLYFRTSLSRIKSKFSDEHLILVLFEDVTATVDSMRKLDQENQQLKKLNDQLREQDNENKKLLQQHRRSEELIKKAEKLAAIGHWYLDLKTNRLEWSDEIYRIFGIRQKEKVRTYDDFLNLLVGESRERVDQAYKQSVTSKEPYELEHEIMLPNGQTRFVLECGKTEYDEYNYPVGSMGTIMDITHRKQYELDLLDAQRKAEESNTLKNEFLQNISHEVRTPLNGILGFSELLMKDGINEEMRRKYGSLVCVCGHQLLQVITDILELSRITACKCVCSEEMISPSGLLLQVKHKFESKANEKNIALQAPAIDEQQAIKLCTNQFMLVNILERITDNAIKFTSKGRVKLDFKIFPDNIEFSITDTGIGIEEEFYELIFDRFTQVERAISKKVGGLGLGLALAKEYANIIGATIKLKSNIGVGSKFTVVLPLNGGFYQE